MNKKVEDWIKRNLSDGGRVLDVGSFDVNGSPSHLFGDYRGVDIREGSGVDIVLDAETELVRMFGKESFDTVLCLSTLEHVKRFWFMLGEIHAVIKKGGLLFLSVPGISFPEHDHPSDYWRFTKSAVTDAIMEGYKILDIEEVPTKPEKNYIINCLGKKI